MNVDKLAIAERIRMLRAQKKIKQVDLVSLIGIKNGTLSMIERGDQMPTIPQIAALSEFFNVSIDYLVKGSKDCVA